MTKEPQGPTSSFLEKWFEGGGKVSDKTLHRHSIKHDKWDQQALDALTEGMKEFRVAQEQLGNFAPQSGVSMFGDALFSLYKARPRQVDPKKMRPTHIINHAVMDEAIRLSEHERLHRYSVADDVAAGLAAVSMEPHLEEIYDRLKTEQDALQNLMDQMQQYQQYMVDLEELLELIGDEEGDGEGQGGAEGEGDGDGASDMQEQQALIEEQMRRLREEMEGAAKEIDKALDEAGPEIQAGMRQAMSQALDDAEVGEAAAISWGLDPGGLKHLPADERIALAAKLKSEKFRRIAELFGPMTRMAMSEQNRKVYHAAEEIFDIEQGKELSRILPGKLAQLRHPVLKWLFMRDFVEGKVLQYKLQGVEKVAKGGIIFCEDGSGSMGGGREIWAKAVGLCLLRIAKEQKRDFYGIHFGGTGELMEFDFRGKGFEGKVTTKASGRYASSYPDEELPYIEGVIKFAETFFGGGTDFMSPLSKALDLQREQFSKQGRVDGDIVFVTDGYCGVHDNWLEEFKSEQTRLGFRVWGIVIGGSADGEPLNTIADGRVFEIKDLTSGEEMRDIFRNM